MTSIFELNITEGNGENLSITMLIDGIPFGKECVDLAAIRKSAFLSGACNLQTCGCVIPECAGFWKPIIVQHSGDVVWWEFDARYHPKVQDDAEQLELSVSRYKFDRKQYFNEIREKFNLLRSHPRRDSIGPHGFNAAILDEDFPEFGIPWLPFSDGAVIVVGYLTDFSQPWVWVEDEPKVYPRQILPTGSMWAKYGYWSLMWDSALYDLGPCAYRKGGEFKLRNDVTISECNKEAEWLARDIQEYWRNSVRVLWDKTLEITLTAFVRCSLVTEADNLEGTYGRRLYTKVEKWILG